MGKRPANVYLSKNLNRPKSFIIKQAMTVSKKYFSVKEEIKKHINIFLVQI